VNLDEETNRLRVETVGEKITVYVNGDLLTSVEDSEIAEGRIGFLVSGGTRGSSNHVAFDNLKLYVPEGPPTGEPTIGPITWYESMDEDGQVENPVSEYPRGTTEIIANWGFDNMEQGLEWGYVWLYEGEVLVDKPNYGEWAFGQSGTHTNSLYGGDGNALDSGDYEIELYLEGEEVQSATTRIR
jgi:hypothetical protein